MTGLRTLTSTAADHAAAGALRTPTREPLGFHRRLDGYRRTDLVSLERTAESLGLERLWLKDETKRFGLPSFKVVGASWATYRALSARPGSDLEGWDGTASLAERFAGLRPLRLVAATDGNHGRAVAHLARLFGLSSTILVPAGMAASRIAALEGEGADVIRVDGSYDDAVARSAEMAGPDAMVISDTAWPGYEQVPSDVIDGYSTIFWEVDDELAERGETGPDLVLIQMGVGSLATAVVAHFRRPGAGSDPLIVGVEPLDAACVQAAVAAGGVPRLVPGPHRSIMSGLNAGLPALIALPALMAGVDGYVALDDSYAITAMRALAGEGRTVGETGAAGLAGLIALSGDDSELADRVRSARRVLVVATEGATDPEGYARAVAGATPESAKSA
ncbi:MAG: diaminopropionate ammonia-lyase [Gaiellales bacterium]|jgi:diaminopropionate ammonia-lyase|nr:diaminopropionate ammonia-lyase [Gaiellales bacterium]